MAKNEKATMQKLTDALTTISDYCYENNCEKCAISDICGYLETQVEPPWQWDISKILKGD